MSPADLQKAKDDLAILEAERMRRLSGGRVVSSGNGAETVTRSFASYDALMEAIRELRAVVRAADPCAYGAIHLR